MIPCEFPPAQVLLVEDDPFIRTTLKKMLRAMGCQEIQEAADGSAALQLLEGEFRPAIILCDVRMVPMDGLTFLAHLRALAEPSLSAVPVIMLTGAVDESIMQSSTDLGVSGYLLKPVSSKTLREYVRAILELTAPPVAGALPLSAALA